MSDTRFKTHNQSGKPVTCKFCRTPVALDTYDHRIYELDKKTLHVDNCP